MSPTHRAIRFVVPALLALLLIPASTRAAGPIYWDWPADRPFLELDLDGAALDLDGYLTAGLSYRALGPVGPEVFWRIVPDGRGGYYTGSGHNGEIHHMTARGDSELVAQLEGTEVFSLLPLPDGGLLAGCGPEGGFYHVDEGGEVTQIGSVAGGYVWAMASQPGQEQNIWLAVGSPASLYRYRMKDDQLEEILQLPAQNTLDLLFDDQGQLLVATQGPGLVYRIDPQAPDTSGLLLETVQDEARQFVRGPDDALFVLALDPEENRIDPQAHGNGSNGGPSTALLAMLEEAGGPGPDRAALYRLDPDGMTRTIWTGSADLMIAGWSEKRGWVGAGPLGPESDRAVLHQLTLPAGQHPLAAWVGGDVLDLQVDGDGRVLICQAHPGAVAVLSEEAGEPRRAVSQPLDAGRPVRWGRLSWSGRPGEDRWEWSVRGGNRSVPDDSWTEWTKPWNDQDHEIALEPCRFLQWRVEFTAGSDSRGTVTGVSVSAWRDNLPPIITDFTVELLKAVNFGPMGGHGENVTQTFASGLQAEFTRGTSAKKVAGPERSNLARGIKVFTWQGRDPDGDLVTWNLEFRPTGGEVWSPILMGTPEQLGSWDTSEVADGRYDVRLTARDDRDNPHHLAGSSSRLMGQVAVDNSPPEISKGKFLSDETGFRVRIEAEDQMGPLAGAVVVLPDGTRERIDPVDGICDSRREDFDVQVVWPRPGIPSDGRPWRVGYELWDLSGNMTRGEGEVE